MTIPRACSYLPVSVYTRICPCLLISALTCPCSHLHMSANTCPYLPSPVHAHTHQSVTPPTSFRITSCFLATLSLLFFLFQRLLSPSLSWLPASYPQPPLRTTLLCARVQKPVLGVPLACPGLSWSDAGEAIDELMDRLPESECR